MATLDDLLREPVPKTTLDDLLEMPVPKTTMDDLLDVGPDENDPLSDDEVAFVTDEHRKKIKYTCAPCKPTTDRPLLPCMAACSQDAIEHSW